MIATAPASLTSLIGRERECAWVRATLGRSDVRLLTLTGPGGVGKTCLARKLTAKLAPEFPGGAYFVSLAVLADPALVLPSIAHAIGLPNDDSSSIHERLQAVLGSSQTLVTLDHLEQVAAVAPELVQMLGACPGLTVMVTSRSPLGVEREHVLPVPKLPVPDFGRRPTLCKLRTNAAVKCFVQWAKAADPGFTLTEANAVDIGRICVLLEGLPLALELVAARLKGHSATALLEQLSTQLSVPARKNARLPERQQTLRATIRWSDNLLSPVARTMLRQLSVFVGGCDALAAESIRCDPECGTPDRVCDGLAELLDHGFLRWQMVAGEARLIMPEMICEYAVDDLDASGEADAAHHRHAIYFLTLAEEASPAMLGPDQEAGVAQLETEHHNLRAALRWSLAHDPDVALRLAVALWRFWYGRGYLREGQYWLDRALATGAGQKTMAGVRALNGLGVLVWAAGNLERALRLQNASLSLAQELNDRWGMAAAAGDRAIIKYMRGGDAARAQRETEHVLGQFRALGDQYLEATALTALGNFARVQGNLTESTHRFQEALDLARQCSDSRGQVLCLSNLGETACAAGDLDRAGSFFVDGLQLAHRLGAQQDVLYCLAGLGSLAVACRKFERGARLLGAAAVLAESIEVPLQPAEQAQFDRDVEAVREALPEADFFHAWEARRSWPLAAVVAEVLEEANAADSESPSHALTDRELDVLRLLVQGLSNQEIAEALFISPATATTHVKHILAKLGVHTRASAVAHAVDRGLV